MPKKRTVAIIQARMASSRLPGKVLADLAGQPMLARVVRRARRADRLDGVAVATTIDPSDDPVEELCRALRAPCTRGHRTDVLGRYMQAAGEWDAQAIVRLTADCPLIDPEVIDRTVAAFQETEPSPDYASNRLRRTYPVGLDVEVVTRAALARAAEEATEDYQREHVTPYLYEQPGRFRLVAVESGGDCGAMRWTVDTQADLDFVREVYGRFDGRDDFTWREVLQLLEREPELREINAHVRQRNYREAE
jgi:spore coat polysaccharide biosynthesis protein SpsF